MLTLRWFGLALLIPALLLLAAAAPFLTTVAVAYAAVLLMLTWLDRYSAGKADQFRVERLHDQKLSLAVPNPVRLEIESRAVRVHQLTIRDEPPVGFVITDSLIHNTENGLSAPRTEGEGLGVRVNSATQEFSINPRESLTIIYHVRPLQRGDFQFGNINLRWVGPLKLYTRQAVIPASRAVKVYPNIYEIRRYELLVRRDQLAEMGLHNVRLRSEGTAFESLRDYTPDDPYRFINWKATARRGKPISTDYEPERNQRVVIMLDVGRMMRSAIRVDDPGGESWNMAKVDFVINSTLLLSYVASRKGDQVGLLVFADQVKQFVPPEPGNAHFQKLLEAMYALGSEPVEADYARAVSFLRARQKKRALVVMFTDLSGARASENLLAHMPRLAPSHLPLLVTIRDPVLDQEAQQIPQESESVYRRAVAEQLIDERRLVLDNLRRRGVLTLDVDAAHLSIDVVNRYLQLKNRQLI
ncbi:MAG: DUF58 domain-containing protein [Anaerolineae bacterium]|nr:DUF58 domain-containing protein [Anaerolineae bacterium]